MAFNYTKHEFKIIGLTICVLISLVVLLNYTTNKTNDVYFKKTCFTFYPKYKGEYVIINNQLYCKATETSLNYTYARRLL